MTPSSPYGQEQPTEAEALRALAELVGPRMAEGIWGLTAGELGLDRPIVSAGDMRRMAEQMMTSGDMMRVAGRSTKVRVITYEAMTRAVPS